MITIHNGGELVIPRHQLPRLQLCSITLFNDIFLIANPCSLVASTSSLLMVFETTT